MPILDVYTPDNECVLMGGTERNEVNYISASTQICEPQEPEVDRQPGLRPRLPSQDDILKLDSEFEPKSDRWARNKQRMTQGE